MDSPEGGPSGANGVKRRQSELSEQESKRQRVSPGKSSPTVPDLRTVEKRDAPTESKAEEPDPREARRKSSALNEKQRSKRLFGALLGNLNQPSDRVSKRRQEIESRRKAELQRQDDERLEDKQRRAEQLLQHRRGTQLEVDEQTMHLRHSNMLNAANFLQTSTEPKLYYRPWELRPDEEDRIEDQIKQAQAQIDLELSEYDSRQRSSTAPRPQNDEGQQSRGAKSDRTTQHEGVIHNQHPVTEQQPAMTEEAEKQAQAKSDDTDMIAKPAEVPDSDPTNHSNDGDTAVNAGLAQVNEADEEGDHVVEGDEDTVIY